MRSAFTWVIRLGLAALFGYAGVMKLLDPEGFAREIANYQLFPDLAPHLAATLPTLECVAALALLAPDAQWRRAAALTITGMLVMFLVAVIWVLARGVNVDCGCFGTDSGSITWLTVARDLALIGAAAYLVFEEGRTKGSDRGVRVGGGADGDPDAGAATGRPA